MVVFVVCYNRNNACPAGAITTAAATSNTNSNANSKNNNDNNGSIQTRTER